MKGDPAVIEVLNRLLADEYAAAIQYGAHATAFDRMGLRYTAQIRRDRQAEEHHHAAELLDLLSFYDATPVVQPSAVALGSDVKSMLDAERAAEVKAIARYNAAIKTCADKGANEARARLEEILVEEQAHTDYIEGELALVGFGLPVYLTAQIRDGKTAR